MKIEQVIVKNFKSLKNVSIKLSNLTLLTGVNSSGKSSFIQVLLLLKQNLNNINTSLSFHSILATDKNKELIKYVEGIIKTIPAFSLDGEYIQLGSGKNILYQNAFNENIDFQLCCTDNQSITISFDVDHSFTVEHNNITDTKYNKTLDVLKNFHYIRTDRAIPSITYPLSIKHIDDNSIGFNGEYTTHYLAENRHKILDIKQLKHPDTTTEQLLENVSAWLGEISSGINISATVHEPLQMASLTYQYEYDDQTTAQYTPLNVGFGITYVLPIIVAILKSEPGELLIIENPESHLHPAGQSKIAELCAIAASNGVQLIIETHSDHFLNGVRVSIKKEQLKPEGSQIYYFEKGENNLETITTALNIDKDGRISEWPTGFFDEWDNKLNELLW